MAQPWAHELWTAEAAQRGMYSRVIRFAPIRGKVREPTVLPWEYTGRDARRHREKSTIQNTPMAQPWAHECWTAEAAQRGTYSRAIIFAPSGATFVSPWFYRGNIRAGTPVATMKNLQYKTLET
ncbi:MAG: hypothetical protein ACLPVO_07830 [Desulfomonilaceae bacterium]